MSFLLRQYYCFLSMSIQRDSQWFVVKKESLECHQSVKVLYQSRCQTPNSSIVTSKCVCIMIPFQVAIYSLSSLLMDSHWIYQTVHTFVCCIAPPRSCRNKMGQNTRNKNVFYVQFHRPVQVSPVQIVVTTSWSQAWSKLLRQNLLVSSVGKSLVSPTL
jgi:hypothetical protein